MDWYNKMWSYTVEFFRSLDVPVRTWSAVVVIWQI